MRAPSFGFVYLVAVGVSTAAFFVYLNRPRWFDKNPGWSTTQLSREQYQADLREYDLGQAHYFLRLARGGSQSQQAQWLRRATTAFLGHAEWRGLVQALEQRQRVGIPNGDGGIVELVPQSVWQVGLDADGWTQGAAPAYFLLHNPGGPPKRFRFTWSTRGDGDALFAIGAKNQPLLLQGGEIKTGTATSPPVAGDDQIVVAFRAVTPFAQGTKSLGLKFEGVEIE